MKITDSLIVKNKATPDKNKIILDNTGKNNFDKGIFRLSEVVFEAMLSGALKTKLNVNDVYKDLQSHGLTSSHESIDLVEGINLFFKRNVISLTAEVKSAKEIVIKKS
ncbi:MAG: hypothetical protein DKM50_14165 [Candidatus Margulisiibacteriota bacterium]|nr:MAG: hypothetical protein A2X43_09300 [Candidatus Margulisbacteria bacterium GWD2_39_127]OGI09071.1 MAG: hypothetical protein A2X41_00905 [Candidatus Margulisbacteria bacterium GWE2_39_32]PZM77018.1 MAG: hypothetical protein DKM50_14165 [Candidatus Margulisiibacteriota bacterium]HAR64072.1 hypothetical protein [Candidatus Margulisiibacteriota bacterium]HCT84960.1 hypothetical protein [Candidatus Margulisiibacteriota bacterium]